MANRSRKFGRAIGGALVLLAALGWYQFTRSIRPEPSGKPFYLRINSPTSWESVASELADRKVIRSVWAAKLYAQLHKVGQLIEVGTYRLRAGMTLDQVLNAVHEPVFVKVRIPEGWWISRVARKLERQKICSATEYEKLAAMPAQFQKLVSFPLPSKSLEGYLFPDTYDLAPLGGAQQVIEKQLRTFQTKAWPKVSSRNAPEVLTVASMVENEVKVDAERPIVAGVIANRLKDKMPLQIDATVLFALQTWKVLKPNEVKTVDSEYNTYLHKGLPPGPIGSPGLKSIEAAISPQPNPNLYYVAQPNGTHLFSPTYSGHIANIRKRQRELKK